MEKVLFFCLDVGLIATLMILVFLNEHFDKPAIDSICPSFRTYL